MKRGGWYGHPVGAVCAALAVLAVSWYTLSGADMGPREDSSLSAFIVTLRHDAHDARDIERTIAVPIEDALAAIPGISGSMSYSEYGLARVVVRFAHGTKTTEKYDAVREAVQRVYESLPDSVERPSIRSTSEGSDPVWTAAVISGEYAPSELGSFLDRTVRPRLEKIDGVGDVELAGSGVEEVLVDVDAKLAAALGLSPASIARVLAESDALVSAGALSYRKGSAAVIADCRYQTELDLATAPIPTARGAAVPLGALARVQTRERVTDAKARVDALPAITIAISPGGGANLISLSKALGVETQALSEEFNVSFRVLSDTGADVARSYAATGIAMLQGICAVALMTALLVSPARGGRGAPRRYAARAKLVAIASVPFMLTVAAAMLVALGFGLDRFALAGLAVGLGGTVDSAILAAERLGSSADAADGMEAMRSLTPALASGAATTLVVLVPLAALDFVSGGIATIAAAIASVCVVSFVSTLVLVPAFVLGTDVTDALYHGRSIIGRGLGWRVRQASRLAHRTLARGAMLCERKPLPVIMVAALLSVAGVLVIVCMPYDASRTEDNSITAARVEFEPGTSLSRVDASLAEYALAIGKEPGIKGTRTTAQRGSGTVYVSFDANMLREDDVPEMLRRLAVPGSFVWIPRATPGEQLWELVVSGDDDEICRAIAGEAARLASAVPGVKETLLNFKEGPENVVYHLDRARAAVLGTDMARASQSLRGALHGYVAYKRLSIDGETDVRVRALNPGEPTLDDAGTVLTGIEAGYTTISSLMTLERVRDVTRIHRQDRKRVAAITLRTDILDANTASKVIRAAVASLRLPPGYSIEFDRDAMETYERLGSVAGSFVLALVMAYMAIAFLAESFTVPLVVLSVVPPSLAVPAIVLAATGTPFDAAFACAFVAVTGMVVNASVLTAEELRASKNASSRPGAHELYKAMRSRFGVVLATGGTSIAGALPFLFLTDSGGSIVRALSLVTAGGIAASIVAALTVVPAIARLWPGLLDRFCLCDVQTKKGIVQ